MTLVIGTDEAGYGPNLGPLVVAASVYRVAAEIHDAEVVLSRSIAAALAAVARPALSGPLWADSKLVYRAGAGFGALERGVLAGLVVASGAVPTNWQQLAAALGIAQSDSIAPETLVLDSLSLPRTAQSQDCHTVAAIVRDTLASEGVSLLRMACRTIQPQAFNLLLATGLNKSDILSRTTLELAAALRTFAPTEPVLVWCDRHGGRKSYAALVARSFDTPLIQPLEETATRSVYALPGSTGRIEFCVAGESRVPVALASMTAKYLREISMWAFNAFWSSHVPGLRPTAGYPLDAKRWRRDAQDTIQSLGISAEQLWRSV